MKTRRLTLLSTLFFATTIFMVGCGDNENNSKKTSGKADKEMVKKEKKSAGDLKIAYYVQDSIGTGFNFYREIDSMLKSKEREFERQLRGKYENYSKYEANIRKRMDAGEITGYQLEDIQQEAMQKQEAIANFERQRGAQLQQESLQYQTALMNKISEAGREFCEDNDIDLLYFYQKGGQITYISNAYDVTEDFVSFLNRREEDIMSGVEKEIEEGEDDDENVKGLDF